MTREEHLNWCKQRALRYIEAGDATGALSSMFSDLGKHEETKNHAAIRLGAMLMFAGKLNTPHEAKKFIEGFH